MNFGNTFLPPLIYSLFLSLFVSSPLVSLPLSLSLSLSLSLYLPPSLPSLFFSFFVLSLSLSLYCVSQTPKNPPPKQGQERRSGSAPSRVTLESRGKSPCKLQASPSPPGPKSSSLGWDGGGGFLGVGGGCKKRITKLKGKIVQNFFTFFTLFHHFSPQNFPFKRKGFGSRRTKGKKI